MSTHKYIDFVCVAVLVCTLLITLLFINGESFGLEPLLDGDSADSDSAYFTSNDRNGGWDSAGATRITLSGDHASVSGGGAYVYGRSVVIAQAGRYVVSGTLSDGSIVVDTDSNSKVWIMLNGAEINCSDNACLRVEQADKVFLTLAEGTENSLSSGAAYSEEAVAANVGGTIFSRDDLTINGSGSLRVTAAYKQGIDVNDELVITGGSITIEAPQDGIHVNDGFCMEEATLNITAGDEGINLQGPDRLLYIASGSIGVDSAGAGIKCAASMLIDGGSIDIRSDGDGLHSDGDVSVNGGALCIRSGDDGIHADSAVSITGGIITISECYEGIEALTIDISGGEIEIYPTDDGMNANGGSNGFGPGHGMFMQQTENNETTQDTETWIHISGGSITIVNDSARDADGLDSNSDIVISGGTIHVSLTASGSNNAIDYGSESGGFCQITGGNIVACGSSVMMEGFSDTSTQCAVLYNLGYTAAAGTAVTVKDAEGREILGYEVPCDFSSVALSSPELKLGETYTVFVGQKNEEIILDSVSVVAGSASGGFGGLGGGMGWSQIRQSNNEASGERPEGTGRGGMGGRQGGWNGQPGAMDENETGTMPTPPDFNGEMPNPEDMPTPTDFGGMRPNFGGGTPDPSAMPQGMGGGQMRRDEAPNEMQSTDEEAAELAIEEAVPPGPQPVSSAFLLLIGGCVLALALGILIAVKYRQ